MDTKGIDRNRLEVGENVRTRYRAFRRRKRVTLIAAFRCDDGGRPGAVICADSQETCGPYRVTVDKIKPRDAGNFDLVVGGAGSIGILIDNLCDAIERNVRTWPAGMSEHDTKTRLESVLQGFNNRYVKDYPANDKDDPEYKVMEHIVCVRDKASSQIHLWHTQATVARAASEYAVVGFRDTLYKYEVGKRLRGAPTLWQAKALGLYLLSVGKQTGNYVNDPFQVITFSDKGAEEVPPEQVQELSQKTARTDEALSKLLLTAANPAASDETFGAALQLFEEEVTGLRRSVRDYVLHTKTGRFNIRMTGGSTHAFVTRLKPEQEGDPPPDSETSEGQP